MPEDAAQQLGLSEIRQSAKGIWWIVLVLSLAVWLGAVFHYLDTKLFDGWLKARLDRRKRQEREREFAEALALRLRSLDGDEQMWIKYCLYHNTQTLSAERTNRTAQSLYHKGIVEEGSGHLLDLPFHIPDKVWRYLLEHKDEFLLEQERDDRRFPAALQNYRKSLWANF